MKASPTVRLVALAGLLILTISAATEAEKSLVGDWLMRPAAEGEVEPKGPGIPVTFTLEGDKVTGKATQGDRVWTLTEIRYDSRVLTFRVHNGEEFLDARLKRIEEGFEGSYVGSESRSGGRVLMRRKK